MASILGGFLRRLTGGGGGDDDSAPAPLGPAVEYNGYTIQPAPRRQGGQWLTAGTISKDFPDESKSQHFVRAETHAGTEQARDFSIVKAKQIIDERGDKLFTDRAPPAPEA